MKGPRVYAALVVSLILDFIGHSAVFCSYGNNFHLDPLWHFYPIETIPVESVSMRDETIGDNPQSMFENNYSSGSQGDNRNPLPPFLNLYKKDQTGRSLQTDANLAGFEHSFSLPFESSPRHMSNVGSGSQRFRKTLQLAGPAIIDPISNHWSSRFRGFEALQHVAKRFRKRYDEVFGYRSDSNGRLEGNKDNRMNQAFYDNSSMSKRYNEMFGKRSLFRLSLINELPVTTHSQSTGWPLNGYNNPYSTFGDLWNHPFYDSTYLNQMNKNPTFLMKMLKSRYQPSNLKLMLGQSMDRLRRQKKMSEMFGR